MRSATSSTSPPTPPTPTPRPRSSSWPTTAATRRTSSASSSPAWALYAAPVDDLHSNWAYMLIAALAWNIKSWHAMMMHRKHDRHAFIRMEFKRFLDTVIRIPAMVLVRARAIVVRLIAYTVNIDRVFSAWATTERIRSGHAYVFAEFAHRMHLAGYNVFVMPKHGGHTVEQLLQRHHDAIGHIAGELDDTIGLYGEGLGGYVVFYLALAHAPVGSIVCQNAPAIMYEPAYHRALL